MDRNTKQYLLIGISLIVAYAIPTLWFFYDCTTDPKGIITCFDNSTIASFYQTNIRGHLFSGYLGLGGFLISLKAFIVVTMKTNVYDSEEFEENWIARNMRNPKNQIDRFTTLKQLSDQLFSTIIWTLLCAASQMTLGLISHWSVAILCVWIAIVAIFMLLNSLLVIKENLDVWFEYLNKRGN
jgi:hypothetical protein